jgi:uncharacterized protein (DUF736 family)
MAYEPKDMTGSLFVNDKKESDKHPDSRGSALIDGVEYWVSAWREESKSGVKYLSMKYQRKDQRGSVRDEARQEPQPDLDDDIPF